jgi:hypothetical protein
VAARRYSTTASHRRRYVRLEGAEVRANGRFLINPTIRWRGHEWLLWGNPAHSLRAAVATAHSAVTGHSSKGQPLGGMRIRSGR